jgi:hypothetical protein
MDELMLTSGNVCGRNLSPYYWQKQPVYIFYDPAVAQGFIITSNPIPFISPQEKPIIGFFSMIVFIFFQHL